MNYRVHSALNLALVFIIAAALVIACENSMMVTPHGQEEALFEASAFFDGEAASRGSAHDTASIETLPGFDVVEGTSKLTRTRNGVSYRFQTSDLEPGHAYTLWIVIFNDPDGCQHGDPCGPMDVVNNDARPDMMYAAGNIVGGAGKATFAGRRAVGDVNRSANGPVGLPAYGLEDPFGAEIWLVVHDHGPKIAQFLPDMIKTIDGGCTDAGIPETGVSSPWNDHDEPGVGAFGERGPNTCASIQQAIHRP